MKLKSLTLVGLLFTVVLGEKVRYDNYKVYRVAPKTEKERSMLLALENDNQGVKFWKGVRNINDPVDVMVAPQLQSSFENTFVNQNNIASTVFIENVQKVLDKDALGAQFWFRKPVDWKHYSRLSEIYKFYDKLAKENPDSVEVLNIGKTTRNRDLKVVKVSKSGKPKPAIWYDSNIHAREWISGASCTYVLNELVNSKNETMVKMTEDFDWYVMCIANPDGYEYSHTVDRMWRKTRSKTDTFGCYGVDPNRNWSYKWMSGGASNNSCSETYGGPSAFSEPETKAISQFYTSIAKDVVFYLSCHAYSQLILLPYGFSNEKYPGFDDDLRIGNAAGTAISKRYGTEFKVGNIVDTIYVASGGSCDWVKGVHNTSLVLTYELRDTGKYGFLLPRDQIIPSSLEFIDSLTEIIKHLRIRLQDRSGN